MKSRKIKMEEYEENYSHIPIDFTERLNWLYDTLRITDVQASSILEKRNQMINQLNFTNTNIILFEVPEGSPRPRFRLVNRANIANMALSNPNFIHVYSPTGYQDYVFMKRLMEKQEFEELDRLICTPCNIVINAYCKTPSYYNKEEKILAEIGLDRPLAKPDWDNICKKYSDMFNKNIWLDDTLTVDGSIHKYYSALPRIEIRLSYLNMVYNRHQFKNITNRTDYNESYNLKYFGMEG